MPSVGFRVLGRHAALVVAAALALLFVVVAPADASSPRTFTASPRPTVTGTAQVGATLTARPGTWRPAPVKLTYQWKRSGVAIAGATKTTYKLAPADAGKLITVKVTGRKANYKTVSRTSKPTAAVKTARFVSAPKPKIVGTATVRGTLTANPGTWSPTAKITYQWLRNGSALPGATGKTYRLTFDDEGAGVAVRVTGSRTGYASKTVTSAAVTVLATDRLRSDEVLNAGRSLRSPNGSYTLVMQGDGNLVEYGPSGATWSTGGGDANHVVMQSDGNLVSRNAAGTPRWDSGSWGTGGTVLAVQDDGNLVIYDAAGKAVWARNVVGWLSVYTGSTANGQPGTQSQSAPNLTSTLFKVYPVATRLPVVCGVTNGQAVDGSATPGTTKTSTWHRLLWGDWVPDADFKTTVNGLVPKGTIGFVASEPNCNGSSVPSTPLPGINGWVFPIQPHATLTTYSGHNGDDFPVPIGTPVYAMYGGAVSIPAAYKVEAKWCPVPAAIGRVQQDLIVTSNRDGATYRFDYAHLDSFSVSNGQAVNAGDLLGYSGNKGCVTGPHLHIDIKLNGVANQVFPHSLIGWKY